MKPECEGSMKVALSVYEVSSHVNYKHLRNENWFHATWILYRYKYICIYMWCPSFWFRYHLPPPPYPCKYMMVELSQRDLPSWLLSTFQGDGKTDTEYLGQMLSWVRGRGGVFGPKKGCISDQVDGTPEAVVVSDVLTAWSCFYVWFVFKSIVWVWRSSIV